MTAVALLVTGAIMGLIGFAVGWRGGLREGIFRGDAELKERWRRM